MTKEGDLGKCDVMKARKEGVFGAVASNVKFYKVETDG